MATLPDYGITYDEPIYMEAAWNVKKWLSLEPKKMFTQEEVERHWRTDPRRNIHPSGLKWLYLVAQKTILWENDPYTQIRIWSVLLFSISFLCFLLWWSEGSLFAGIAYVLLLLSIPRFFAHAHFAATDVPTISLLLLFVVCLDKTLFQRSYWLAGILLGCLASIKATASLFVLPVLVVFFLWYKQEWRKVCFRIGLICLIAIVTFYALNPDWWYSPLLRGREFFVTTLTRRQWTPFTVFFGGNFYSYRGPFYYPFVIFFITTPLLHILFLISGLGFFLADKRWRRNFKMILSLVALAFPFLVLALPISPTNDGVRYLLPAFPFAACFMALGLTNLGKFAASYSPAFTLRTAARWIIILGALLLLAGDLVNPARRPPYELSYYNRIVGGVSGANVKGYEMTYWFEILNDDVLRNLNKRCGGASVYFPLSPTDLFFEHMRRARKIEFSPVMEPKGSTFMFIIGRPYVTFWESKSLLVYEQEGKIPVPVWDISFDSVTLLKLYAIQSVENKTPSS